VSILKGRPVSVPSFQLRLLDDTHPMNGKNVS
jgi:hypothetical protein